MYHTLISQSPDISVSYAFSTNADADPEFWLNANPDTGLLTARKYQRLPFLPRRRIKKHHKTTRMTILNLVWYDYNQLSAVTKSPERRRRLKKYNSILLLKKEASSLF